MLYPGTKSGVVIKNNHLTYYAFVAKQRYRDFTIPKKSGGSRQIRAPKYKLKVIQQCLNVMLNCVFTPHKAAFGFVPGRSIVDNAKNHINKGYVYNADLKDFFPSVAFRRVKTVLQLKPLGLNDELAFMIANLCCEGGTLPQGAPTSPTLTNLVSQRMDWKLYNFAGKHKTHYSRYADDISFSAHKNVFGDDFKAEFQRIIHEEGFELNPKKERLQDRTVRQEVTGVVVNSKTNINRTYYKDVRYWLRTWRVFGEKATQRDFARRYKNKKGALKREGAIPHFRHYLRGKIHFLGMVRGGQDATYRKLISEYWLIDSGMLSNGEPVNSADANQFLDIWEKSGIDAAINHYRNLTK